MVSVEFTQREAIGDLVAELSAATATLGKALHPRTAANVAGLVRIMNVYYSNLIEAHNTQPKDIERALAGNLEEMKGGATCNLRPPRMCVCRRTSTG